MRIVISEFMDEAAVAALAAHHATLYDAGLVDRRDELKAKLVDADALIVRNRTQVNVELLAAAPRLAVVGRLGVGLDNIDVAACKAREIAVIPATGANALAVAEYVIGVSMALLRGAYFATADVASGKWPRAALSSGRVLSGKTLGIVGFGGIGRLTGRLGRALGMRVIGFDAEVGPDAPVWREEGVDASHVRTNPDAFTGIYFVNHGPQGHAFSFFRAGSAASWSRAVFGSKVRVRVGWMGRMIGWVIRASTD